MMAREALEKTKAEEAFAKSFAGVRDALPGDAATGAARAAAFERFDAIGLPHRRIEEWKYTDLRAQIGDAANPVGVGDTGGSVSAEQVAAALGPLAAIDAERVVFVDGVYQQELSAVAPGGGIDIGSLRALLATDEGAARLGDNPEADAVVSLNTAFVTDGAVIDIAEQTTVQRPVLLAFLRSSDGNALLTTRNIVSVGAGATATILECHASLDGVTGGQTNALSQVRVGDGARCSHIKVGIETDATHLGTWNVTVGGEADYRAFQFTAGMALVRNQVFADFSGENAKLDVSGAFLARGREHIDTTLVVTHELVGCQSRELFKGVLDDQARGVFQGKVIVHPEAQKTDGKQMAQALMLSEACEFDSKPELEIYADDVACGHGSTCAEIDPEMVFYCRSRGIPEDEARALLIEAFIAEAIDCVDDEAINEAIGELARGWLAAGSN